MGVETKIPPGVVLLVAHDAGGAQILANWQKQHEIEALHVIEGPAQKIFRQRECPLSEVSLQGGIKQADWVLTGSGWGSDLEKRAVRAARSKSKFCVTFLDHWANYEFRFELKGVRVMPDEIWVGDEYALAKARIAFPDTTIVQKINPYFQNLRDFFRVDSRALSNKTSQDKTALWVGEDVSDAAVAMHSDKNYRGYSEHAALGFFIENIRQVSPRIKSVVIRPHPSQQASLYEQFLSTQQINIYISDGKRSLEWEILEADVIAGADSMGLVAGVLAGKYTISAIPPGGLPRTTPMPEIHDLCTLISSRHS